MALGQPKYCWTIRSLTYKNTSLMTEDAGCSNGTVLQTKVDEKKRVTWVGTGHGYEKVESVKLLVDGKEKPVKSGVTYTGSTFTLVKRSDLRVFKLEAFMTLTESGLEETHRYTAKTDRPYLALLYAFMHSFDVNMTEWVAHTTRGKSRRGQFVNDNKNPYRGDGLVWTSVYNPKDNVGVVYVVKKPSGRLHHFYWDRDTDQKLYYQGFPNTKDMKAGDQFEYSVALAAYESPKDNWTNKARAAAGELENQRVEP